MVYVVCEAGGEEGTVFGGDADEAAIEVGTPGRGDRSRGDPDEVVEDGVRVEVLFKGGPGVADYFYCRVLVQWVLFVEEKLCAAGYGFLEAGGSVS